MTEKTLADLRHPFPAKSVGILPKPYKKDSPKAKCNECGGYHGMPAVHLDYVGHAIVTGRLLDVDPEWSWEPMGLDQNGLPATDQHGNLWIRLTILGVTRIGVGDGLSAKEAIGDAIRNAAMRFGVALDLWAKEELESEFSPLPESPLPAAPAPTGDLDALKREVWAESIKQDGALTEQERKAWIRGELEALDGTETQKCKALLATWTLADATTWPGISGLSHEAD
jgi:hypothetical protein